MIRQCLLKDQDGRPSCEEVLNEIENFQEDYAKNQEQWDMTIVAPKIGDPARISCR